MLIGHGSIVHRGYSAGYHQEAAGNTGESGGIMERHWDDFLCGHECHKQKTKGIYTPSYLVEAY